LLPHKSITTHKSYFEKQNPNPSKYNQHIMTEVTYIYNGLSKDCTPTDEDILCGRGRPCGKHPGNKKFSAAIKANLQTYDEASKRLDKSNLVASILRSLQENGARFIKQDRRTKKYHELSDGQAHEKTGHAIRDLLKQNSGPSSSISRLKSVLTDSDMSEGIFCLLDDEDGMKAADIHLHDKCYGGTPHLVTPDLFTLFHDDVSPTSLLRSNSTLSGLSAVSTESSSSSSSQSKWLVM
jgi:anaerobic ribonucleoside-triphosphate reductase